MGKLTTHVLDTAAGRPAAGMALELFRVGAGGRRSVRATRTNADGRCDGPLLEGEAFEAGIWELVFQAGAYFRAQGASLSEPPFLDEISIRFGIAAGEAHYHVPLLVSPWSYTTYRGS